MTTLALTRFPSEALGYSKATDGSVGQLRHSFREVERHGQQIASDWRQLIEASLGSIEAECSAEDWDGYGAKPISPATRDMTRRFTAVLINQLPWDTPAPAVVPEADGELSLTWESDPSWIFSTSVSSNGLLNFAGIFGGSNEIRGRVQLDPGDSESVAEIVAAIKRLYSQNRARPAGSR